VVHQRLQWNLSVEQHRNRPGHPFLAEIRLFAFNFAAGWLKCDGQVVVLSQNTALFALLFADFGGNGTTTFGLPDLEVPRAGPVSQGARSAIAPGAKSRASRTSPCADTRPATPTA
jgi:microcystin-dependent protein